MPIKCHISRRKNLGFRLLELNEDPVREITACHPPQCEEKDPRTFWIS